MTFKPYSIVVVPFPFTDRKNAKKRPALVISSERHQLQTEHVTLMMITTGKNSSWPSDLAIKRLEPTGLSTPSIIRQKIFTIDTRLIMKSVGQLSENDAYAVKKQLQKHFIISSTH